MSKQRPDQPDPDAALLIISGVSVPPAHVARIAKMHQAAAAGRDAIRAMGLGETEPMTIFVPLREEVDASHELRGSRVSVVDGCANAARQP